MNADSEITATTMYIECHQNAQRCGGLNKFTGNYIAENPYFLFTYDYDVTLTYPTYSPVYFMVEVTNLTTATSLLYSIDRENDNSDIFYVPTPIGDEIGVLISMPILETGATVAATVNYSMAEVAVAPEPVSSTLFIIGEALLAGSRKRFGKKKV